jgi:integrase/recombinase XerD
MQPVGKINPFTLNAKKIRAGVITKWLKVLNLREAQYVAGYCYINSTEKYLNDDIDGLK